MTIEQYHASNELAQTIEYARMVAPANMLPDTYRNRPADIMLAVGLGQSMGLSPAESLYRINVIKGKPTASAELIAANVRKAGHKLRVITDEQAQSVTAVIIRADDPDFEHKVTRDRAWAESMGLANNDNYKKQGLTMLQWRAITAVARLACPEALYGVSYTPDEMYDMRPQQAPTTVTAEQVHETPAAAQEGEARAAAAGDPREPWPEARTPKPDEITTAQQRKLGGLMREAGITTRDAALAYVNDVLPDGRTVESRTELTKAEAGYVIDALERDGAPQTGEQA